MSDKKEKRQRFITPKGVAMYPWLNTPDTKFKPEGEYHVDLRLSADAAQPLIDKLQPLFDAAVAAAKKNPKNKGKKLTTHDFYKPVLDDDGNETGDVKFHFKRVASGVSKKTGQPWAIKPDLFDASGKPLSSDAKVFGGSVVKVSFEVNPYDKPIGNGISLALAGVQVIKLMSGQRNAAAYGFGDESDDDDADASDADDSTSDGDSDDSDGEGDSF